MMVWVFTAFFFYSVLYIIGNCPYLRVAAGFANDKKISDRFFYFPQVKGNNVITLFLLYSSNNGFDDF